MCCVNRICIGLKDIRIYFTARKLVETIQIVMCKFIYLASPFNCHDNCPGWEETLVVMRMTGNKYKLQNLLSGGTHTSQLEKLCVASLSLWPLPLTDVVIAPDGKPLWTCGYGKQVHAPQSAIQSLHDMRHTHP